MLKTFTIMIGEIMMNNYRYNHQQQWGHHWQNQGYNPHMPQRQRRISIEEAMNIALSQVQGEIVKVELEHEKGILVYEIDIVTAQGVKYEIVVDANNGTVLEVKLD